MIKDFLTIFRWWFWILLISIPFIPLTNYIFKNFFDKGYLFSKSIGIVTLSFVIWFFSSIKILPFSRLSIIILLLIALALTCATILHYKLATKLDKSKIKIFLIEELLFFIGLCFWSYIRGFNSKIYGLEKYMDFGFVNAILKCKYMPPLDIWFSGESINYYYYGHYICAFITKLSNISSAYTYNLMLATIFSFTLCFTFSIASNMIHLSEKKSLKKIIAAGIISALLVTFGGTLHTFVYTIGIHVQQSVGLFKGTIKPYFYADATRYIGYNPSTNDKTIHEFPLYSFVVSDLHGHVSDIPFVLTFIALLLCLFSNDIDKKKHLIIEGFMSVLLAVFYLTNTWDYPIYLMAAGLTFVYLGIKNYSKKINALIYIILHSCILVTASQILALPFTLNFQQIAGGVGIVHAHTPLYQLCVLWGYQLFFILCFIIFHVIKRSSQKNNNITFFTGALALCGIILIILPEIIYIKDIYGITYQRANTMFKFTYQAFIMFGIITGYIVVKICSNIERKHLRIIIAVFFTLVLLIPMMYPFYAIKGYYGKITPKNYSGLYGLNYLNQSYPDDLKAVNWMTANIKTHVNILEANGDSYTDYCRISSLTGNSTIIGWFTHEWLWRGYSEELNKRVSDVQTVYESPNLEDTQKIIKKYNIQYIILGELERRKFSKLNENKLMNMGKIVFKSNNTYIVQVQ